MIIYSFIGKVKHYLVVSLLIGLLVPIFFVVTTSSISAKALNQSGNWHVASHNPSAFLRVDCINVSYCIAVGLEGYVAVTSNSGSSWTEVSVLPLGSSALDVSCFNIINCYLSGELGDGVGALAYSSNGGLNWSQLSVPAGISYLSSIDCVSATNCFSAGSAGGSGAVVETTDGTNFAAMSLPSGVGALSSISCSSGTTCVAVGSTASKAGEAVITSNGGLNWSSVTVPTSTQLTSVDCVVSTSFCEAVGWIGGSAIAISSSNSGSTWAAQVLPGGPTGLNSVSCISSSTCMAVDSGGFVLTTANGGQLWTSDPSLPPGVAGFFGVSCPTTTECLLLGETVFGVASIDLTTDFGTSFVAESLNSDVSWLGLSCSGVSLCVGVGDTSNSGVIEYSIDGGTSWNVKIPNSSVADLLGVSCPTTTTCYAVGDLAQGGGAVVVTNNAGQSWSLLNLPSGLVQLTGISCLSATNCFVSDASGNMGVTTDGATFSVEATPISQSGLLQGVSCVNSTTCVAIGGQLSPNQGAVIMTTNGGANWITTLLDSNAVEFLSVSCVGSTTTYCQVAGTTTNGAIALDTSNLENSPSANWSQENLPAQLTGINSISCVSSSSCSAADASGSIITTPDGGATWIVDTGPYFLATASAIDCITPSQCFGAGGGSTLSTMPTVNGTSPSSGPLSGGTLVTILGSGFTGATGVDFGSNNASFTIINDTTITAVAPAGSAGLVNVTVTTSTGTSVTNNFDGFVYTAPGQYYPVTPTRVCDTRSGANDPATYAGDTLAPNIPLTVSIAGGSSGVPLSASAVALNITAVNPTGWGYFTVYPTGVVAPVASSVNFSSSTNAQANFVQVPLGNSGSINIMAGDASSDLLVDVVGYYAPQSSSAGLYNPVSPTRIVDTRLPASSTNPNGGQFLNAGQSLTVQATGAAGGLIPASGVEAVAVNITVTDTTAQGGYLVAYPANLTTVPTSSNLNFGAGESVPNRAIVQLSPSGAFKITVENSGADIIIDVGGYFTTSSNSTGYSFHALSPVRIVDSRTYPPPTYQLEGKTLTSNSIVNVQVSNYGNDGVPSTAQALSANVTVTDTVSTGGYLTVFPESSSAPVASDLNWSSGETVANATITKLSTSGALSLESFNSATDAIVDVNGWYG